MKWQPIATAPKDGTMILLFPSRCWVDECDRGEVGYWDHDVSEWGGAGSRADDYFGPTHWMPLPDPPEKETTNGTEKPEDVRGTESVGDAPV